MDNENLGVYLVLKTLVRNEKQTLVRMSWEPEIVAEKFHFIAAGQHTGIVVDLRCPPPTETFEIPAEVMSPTRIIAHIIHGDQKYRENWELYFQFDEEMTIEERFSMIRTYVFEQQATIRAHPKSEIEFLKQLLCALKTYQQIVCLYVNVNNAEDKLPIELYEIDVTIQDLLRVVEEAYPEGLTDAVLLKKLKCSPEKLQELLGSLEGHGRIKRQNDEWKRLELRHVRIGAAMADQTVPTIAIIVTTYLEKMAIESMMENSELVTKGKKSIYTVGWMRQQVVVLLKISSIGTTEMSLAAAGSATTRLLGHFRSLERILLVGRSNSSVALSFLQSSVGDIVVSSKYTYAKDVILDESSGSVLGFEAKTYRSDSTVFIETLRNLCGHLTEDINALVEHSIANLGTEQDMEFVPPPKNGVISEGSEVTFTWSLTDAGGLDIPSDHVDALKKFAEIYELPAVDEGSVSEAVLASIEGNRFEDYAIIRAIAANDLDRAQTNYIVVRLAALVRAMVVATNTD